MIQVQLLAVLVLVDNGIVEVHMDVLLDLENFVRMEL
jgi:hypothetical protein